MANEASSTGGGASRAPGTRTSQAAERPALEQDMEALTAQVEALKADLSGIAATLADLVKTGAREGKATFSRTAEHYMNESRRQADAALDEARAYGEALEGQIARNPFSAVLVALGLGFLIGLMSRR
jgi:ElaB/YqjD/DUF883 family membrane-anchored ribosome-binding protein